MGHTIDAALWCKSSYSGSNGGNCVEVAVLPGGKRAVRDSKNPDGPGLLFSRADWLVFTSGLKNRQPG
jgi:hypothetical protein